MEVDLELGYRLFSTTSTAHAPFTEYSHNMGIGAHRRLTLNTSAP